MDGAAEPPDPPSAVSRAESLLERIMAAGYAQVPVVNAVPAPPDVADRAGRWSLRRAARAEKRRRRHPEKFRVEFTAWASLPWRDRPIEARLADFADATADAIARSAAWRHPLLESHRLRLDPAREAAEIAIGAYRIDRARHELAGPLHGRPGALGADAPAGCREKQAALDDAWHALIRRLAALDAYRQHLAEIGPALAAADAAEFLDGAHVSELMGRVTAGGAADEFVASDTERLAAEAAALGQILGRAPLGGQPAPPQSADPGPAAAPKPDVEPSGE